MFRIKGPFAKDLCDSHLGHSRRDFLRVGGAGMIGLTLNNIFAAQRASAASKSSWPFFSTARPTERISTGLFASEPSRGARAPSGGGKRVKSRP